MANDPRRDPTDPPRGRVIMGARLPPPAKIPIIREKQTPTSLIPEDGERKQARTGKWWAGLIVGIATLGTAVMIAGPFLLSVYRELKSGAETASQADLIALEKRIDEKLAAIEARGDAARAELDTRHSKRLNDVQAKQVTFSDQIKRTAEPVCDANQGPPMRGYPCPEQYEYQTPRSGKPLRRAESRTFPE